MMSDLVKISSFIKGYHIYRLRTHLGQILEVRPEPDNIKDEYAVAIYTKDGRMVGHAPTKPVTVNRCILKALDFEMKVCW